MNKSIYNFLFEKEEKETNSPEKSVHLVDDELKARKALDSIDDQIDSLIIKYEQESIRDEENLAEMSFFNNSLKYLFEQDEDPEAAMGDDAEGDDVDTTATPSEPSSPEGSEKIKATKPGEEITPDLDIDAFTKRTVRLIKNHRSLLRLEEAIINRVKNYLDKYYGDEFVVSYLDILENQFGISLSEFDEQEFDQIPGDTFAIGANPAGAGNVGGGG